MTVTTPLRPLRIDPGSPVFLPKGTACVWTTGAGTVAIIVEVTSD